MESEVNYVSRNGHQYTVLVDWSGYIGHEADDWDRMIYNFDSITIYDESSGLQVTAETHPKVFFEICNWIDEHYQPNRAELEDDCRD